MKLLVRMILRVLFWPVGLLILSGTAVIELLDDTSDWEFWRDQNAFILRAMWLKRS